MSKVKEIIMTSARYLGLDSLYDKMVNEQSKEDEDDVYRTDILRCLNLVVGDLAINAVPLKNRKQVAIVNGAILFKNVDSRLCDVKALYDSDGYKIDFTLYHDRLLCKANGIANIEYTYVPSSLTEEDDIPFPTYISDNLLCYGTACEFCLIYDRGAEAVKWERLFSDELEKIESRKPPVGGKLKRRYWL